MSASTRVFGRIGVVEVTLDEFTTSGFRWRVRTLPPGVILLDDRLDALEGGPSLAGGGRARRFRFRVDSAGDYPLEFELGRAWEPGGRDRLDVLLSVAP